MGAVLPILAHAQSETNNWYFGNRCALHFTTGQPQRLLSNPAHSEDGWATISDSTGQLLFYFNNSFVYDRTHTVMPQSQIRAFGGTGVVIGGIGTLGNSNYAADCIVLPWPQRPGQYFVFSSNIYSGTGGLSDSADVVFSRVDLSLRGGLGDVDAGSRRQVLHENALTMVQAARHPNGRDYWVITHEAETANYRAYAVTPAGVSATPVISTAGNVTYRTSGGTATLAPTSRLIAYSNNFNLPDGTVVEDVDLVRFNPATGQCSSYLTLPGAGGTYLAFSLDSKLLYVSGQFNRAASRIQLKQYDLVAGSVAAIQASGQWLGPVRPRNDMVFMGQMQFGPDGRLYIGRQDTDTLAYIERPNRRGLACDLRLSGLWTGPPTLGPSGNRIPRTCFRLPTFVSSFLYLADFTAAGSCLGDSVHLRLRNPQRLDSVRWRFNDPAVRGGGTSTRKPSVAYQYAQPGTYRVHAQVYYDDFSTDTLSQLVTVRPRPTVRLPADTIICGAATVLVPHGLSAGISAYRWNTGATTPTLTVTQPGSYSLTVTAGGCTSTATTQVRTAALPILRLPADTLLCLDTELRLNGAAPGVAAVRWPDGSTGPSYVVRQPGPVRVQFTTTAGCQLTRTVQVYSQECPNQFIIPNIITPNADGKNDGFQITGLEPGAWRLEVYNRWGRQVYNRASYHSGEWRALEQPAGVYYYRLSRSGQQFKGWVEVVR
ncbi:gliding motility-associated C-terminal domain-containing protein [Hymenobacter norwichensis]|uniref:T9SS type B sorting domain-containing protein n=1 Tax=Hymenobacter norwichensis TaxID=223903 RepID=UPI0003B5EF4D|nr:gliding motility-associated C-terminal domain-containing protein [Hymenobacter norwichensis]